MKKMYIMITLFMGSNALAMDKGSSPAVNITHPHSGDNVVGIIFPEKAERCLVSGPLIGHSTVLVVAVAVSCFGIGYLLGTKAAK